MSTICKSLRAFYNITFYLNIYYKFNKIFISVNYTIYFLNSFNKSLIYSIKSLEIIKNLMYNKKVGRILFVFLNSICYL